MRYLLKAGGGHASLRVRTTGACGRLGTAHATQPGSVRSVAPADKKNCNELLKTWGVPFPFFSGVLGQSGERWNAICHPAFVGCCSRAALLLVFSLVRCFLVGPWGPRLSVDFHFCVSGGPGPGGWCACLLRVSGAIPSRFGVGTYVSRVSLLVWLLPVGGARTQGIQAIKKKNETAV